MPAKRLGAVYRVVGGVQRRAQWAQWGAILEAGEGGISTPPGLSYCTLSFPWLLHLPGASSAACSRGLFLFL